ncbi:MAG: type II secretion system protein N [Myxococcota bacterium]|nr:type II secretion system protein N [Myxococcota bacterium]
MSVLGARLANVVLFLAATWLAADVVTEVAASMLIPPPSPVRAQVMAPPPSSQPWSQRQAILDRNLFGAQVIADEIPEEIEPDEDLQETRLPLKLLGTVSSDDQIVASAAIENSRQRTHEVVKVGDRLADFTDVVVFRIDRGRVVLQNGAAREELTMNEELLASAPPVKRPKPSPRPSRRATAKRDRGKKSAKDRLKDLADQSGVTGAAALFSQARVLPKYKDGQMVGIEISQIEADSFYETVGLSEGDMLTNINGITIDTPAASQKLLEAFTSQTPIVAEVTGPGGAPRTINISPETIQKFMTEAN